MYEHVLIPTDGSEGAKRGVEYGLDLAARHGADVHLLYVLDETVYETPALSSGELFIEKRQEAGERILESTAEAAEERGLTVSRTCVRGTPSEAIREYAEGHGIDVVVMGRHGRPDPSRYHIGSCTDRVIRTAPVPVLSV
jgi:nucleotide-binding universal stress UspA family protein